mmetsp:Transcript_96830/g.269286  ORF Transcript_96830/g.269286 Transcript_96830/m.269286 type:complete len:211 (+) Transcript_96830:553-1185(+)
MNVCCRRHALSGMRRNCPGLVRVTPIPRPPTQPSTVSQTSSSKYQPSACSISGALPRSTDCRQPRVRVAVYPSSESVTFAPQVCWLKGAVAPEPSCGAATPASAGSTSAVGSAETALPLAAVGDAQLLPPARVPARSSCCSSARSCSRSVLHSCVSRSLCCTSSSSSCRSRCASAPASCSRASASCSCLWSSSKFSPPWAACCCRSSATA